jgi:N-alpha-acetyltransferase 40
MSTSKRAKRADQFQGRADTEPKLVETANALSATAFYEKYAPPDLPLMLSKDVVGLAVDLSPVYGDAATLISAGETLLKQCLQLIERTSAQDYDSSETKWSNSKKWKEMRLPDMKYIILRSPDNKLVGFVSFMVTYEDGHEVVYVYEIHVVPEWQGNGLGWNLMRVVEVFAKNVGVSKVMLTVFRSNNGAVKWYDKLGYREDEFSPGPRKLRNGTVKQPSYIILSKPIKR